MSDLVNRPPEGGKPERAFRKAAAWLGQALGADQALVVYGRDERLPRVVAAHGMAVENALQGGPVSLSLIEESLLNGKPMLVGDATSDPRHQDKFSVMVAELRSVLCAPFWGPGDQLGVLYAQSRSRTGLFARPQLEAAMDLARKLEALLEGRAGSLELPSVAAPVSRPRPDGIPGPRPPMPPPLRAPGKTAAAAPAARSRRRPPHQRAIAAFLRAFAAMVGAGIPLVRALDLLALQAEDPVLAQAAAEASAHVSSGQTLSSALAQHPHVFSRFQLLLVATGERTGALHEVLERLAELQEKLYSLTSRVRSALTYPVLVLGMALALLILGPPWLMKGQFELIRQSGVEPPALTQALITASRAVTHPLGWVLLGLTALLAYRGTRRLVARPLGARLVARLPGVGHVLKTMALARFCAVASHCLSTGLPLLEVLSLSLESTGHPELVAAVPAVKDAVTGGQSVAEALRSQPFFPRGFVEMIRAGEESGRLPDMLNSMGELLTVELDAALATYVALIEPFVMGLVGLVTAVVLVATLLPTVQALKAF